MAKDKKYIIFFDIDGTLVETNARAISDEVISELRRVHEQGHILAICTGRSLNTTEQLNDLDVFDYLAVLMGNVVKDMRNPSNIKTFEKLSKESAKRIITYLESHNYHWTYKDQYTDKTVNQIVADKNLFGSKLVSYKEMEQDLENDKINQILVCSPMSNEEIQLFPEVKIVPMPAKYMDITSKNASKANAVKYIKSLYPFYTTVGIGDSLNDLEMFDAVDISIAMGNANDETKSHATYVTKHISEDGIAYAMQYILKI